LVAEGKQWLGDSDSLDAFYCGGKNLGEKSAYIQCADYYDGFMVVVSIVEDVTKIKTNVGEDFTINLDSNGTTGYAWEITQQPDENIIKLDKSGYEEICPDDLVGCGNPQYWTYKAQKEGETELELQYRRSWESADQAIQKKIYKIVVLSKIEAQNNLQKMTENLAEVKSMEYNGEFKMTNEEPEINLDINFKGGTDENTIDNPLGYFWLGFDLLNAEEDLNYQGDLEWRMIDKANYWKLNYENEVEDSDLSKYLEVINNQWIKIDEASAKETLEQINLGLVDEDLLDWQEALTGEQNEQIEELNKKYQIIKATKILADEQIGTVSTYHYQYMIDIEEINQLMEEMNQILSPEMNPYRSMNMDDMENITGEIWVGKNDLLPYKMTVEMNQAAEMEIDNLDFVLYFENFNKSLTVETPSSVKTWEEILAELEEIDKIA